MKSIRLTTKQWKKIRAEMYTEYPRTVFMLRDKMRKVLGFTVREHKHWNESRHEVEFEIHLDFYSENKRTMFLLKYSEFLNGQG